MGYAQVLAPYYDAPVKEGMTVAEREQWVQDLLEHFHSQGITEYTIPAEYTITREKDIIIPIDYFYGYQALIQAYQRAKIHEVREMTGEEWRYVQSAVSALGVNAPEMTPWAAIFHPVYSNETPTLGTDDNFRCMIGPWFFDSSFSTEERQTLLAHEMFHPILGHTDPSKPLDHEITNHAGDYQINQGLRRNARLEWYHRGMIDPRTGRADKNNEIVGIFPEDYKTDEYKNGLPEGWTFEQYYAVVYENEEKLRRRDEAEYDREPQQNGGQQQGAQGSSSNAGQQSGGSQSSSSNSSDDNSQNGSQGGSANGSQQGQQDAQGSQGDSQQNGQNNGQQQGDGSGNGSASASSGSQNGSANGGGAQSGSGSNAQGGQQNGGNPWGDGQEPAAEFVRQDNNGSGDGEGEGEGIGDGHSNSCSKLSKEQIEELDKLGVERAGDYEKATARTASINIAQRNLKNRSNGGRGVTGSNFSEWFIDMLRPPKVPWKDIFRKVIGRNVDAIVNGRSDYSFRRPARRPNQYDPTVVRPGLIDYEVRITFGVDTSGSMGNDDHVDALSEIQGALKHLRRAKSTIVMIDTEITETKDVRTVKDITLAGGGGTCMNVFYKWVKDLPKRKAPDITVLATDGYIDWDDVYDEITHDKRTFKHIILVTEEGGMEAGAQWIEKLKQRKNVVVMCIENDK